MIRRADDIAYVDDLIRRADDIADKQCHQHNKRCHQRDGAKYHRPIESNCGLLPHYAASPGHSAQEPLTSCGHNRDLLLRTVRQIATMTLLLLRTALSRSRSNTPL